MKKIPTLFVREYDETGRVVGITDKVTPGMEWVLEGKGEARRKLDGACCAIINGELYKRYDAKRGKTPPEGAIPCCDPDPITGHWPHWVKVDENNPADKWFVNAGHFFEDDRYDGTFEAVGEHFNGNPYKFENDVLYRHDAFYTVLNDFPKEVTFESIKEYLTNGHMEGIVFWLDGQPMCKIKRTDFGLPWPDEYFVELRKQEERIKELRKQSKNGKVWASYKREDGKVIFKRVGADDAQV